MTTMTTDDIRELYNERAHEYQDKSWLLEGMLRGNKLRHRLFGRATGRVLDVACGTGVNFPHLTQAEEIVGVELSSAMLKLAEQRATEVSTPVTLHEMDATQLQFPDASFDTVTSALSTCTFPDPWPC
ncbi:MAG: class I SAM-dependent methyltransferase [Caldilineaceae bacterium]